MTTSTAASSSTPVEDGGLSKAELRRRKILAKRGARMALVAGDRTLGESATAEIASASSAAAASIPPPDAHPSTSSASPSAPRPGAAPPPPDDDWGAFFPPGVAAADGVTQRGARGRRGRALEVPAAARIALLVVCAAMVPVLRATALVPRASALQMFLAAEAVVLAPALVARGASVQRGGGIFRIFSAAATVAGVVRALYADVAVFLLSLFCVLRLAGLYS